MALKRKDLAAQFNDIVKGEIANHNAAICASNIALAKIREEIGSVEQHIEEQVSYVSNRAMGLESVISQKEASFKKALYELRASINVEQETRIKESNSFVCNLATTLSIYMTKEDVATTVASIKEEIHKLSNQLSISNFSIRDSVEKVEAFIKTSNIKTCERLTLHFEEIMKLKKDLFREIDLIRIDSEGIDKELKIIKKSIFIHDKKFENIYTLIEKLKTGGGLFLNKV